jgi:hypothetical protein
VDSAQRLQAQLTIEDADFLPALIDCTSRMQELLNDLLADSRYFLEAQEMGMAPQAPLDATGARGVGGAMAVANSQEPRV